MVIDVGIYLDSMLIDLQTDTKLVSVEMEIACEDPTVEQSEVRFLWTNGHCTEHERYTLRTDSTTERTLKIMIKRST